MSCAEFPRAKMMVEKSILFHDTPYAIEAKRDAVWKKEQTKHHRRAEESRLEVEVAPFSPSAYRHHTYGCLAGELSVVGNNVRPEEWRCGNWEHVDVRRYVTKASHPRR